MFTVLFSAFSLSGQVTHAVSVTNGSFTPKELTITAGDKVIWTNNGTNGHNVNGTTATFPSNPESFGNDVGLGWTYEFVFNTSGTYDYQCDPHAAFGMVGKVIVNPKEESGSFNLTVNFTGMTPHVGETLWLAVIDQATKMEIGRVKTIATVNFSLEVPGIEAGKSYNVDFYADHNKNGVYDPAPADHTWRMQLDNVAGNSVLDFAHNTNFTDIAWKNKLTVHFTGMTPHLDEMLTLFLRESDTGIYKDTVVVSPVPDPTFDMMSWRIKPGKSYHIDFYADHNKNGSYDSPATDHAWRINLNNVMGDTIIDFAHNTKFTDIFGPMSHHITAASIQFTPAIQTITVGDTVIWSNIEGNHNVNGTQATFPSNPESFGNSVGSGWVYKYVFNTPGTYDYQCDPHVSMGMVGKIIVKYKLVTSIAALDDVSGRIQLYPNPATDFINIRLPKGFAAVRSIKIFSITGSLIESKLFPDQSGPIQYNLGRFKTGVYFIEIGTGEEKDVLKFIKQ
jgi:plastocyanin